MQKGTTPNQQRYIVFGSRQKKRTKDFPDVKTLLDQTTQVPKSTRQQDLSQPIANVKSVADFTVPEIHNVPIFRNFSQKVNVQ